MYHMQAEHMPSPTWMGGGGGEAGDTQVSYHNKETLKPKGP